MLLGWTYARGRMYKSYFSAIRFSAFSSTDFQFSLPKLNGLRLNRTIVILKLENETFTSLFPMKTYKFSCLVCMCNICSFYETICWKLSHFMTEVWGLVITWCAEYLLSCYFLYVDISSILKSQIELIAIWCDIILFLLICWGVMKQRKREDKERREWRREGTVILFLCLDLLLKSRREMGVGISPLVCCRVEWRGKDKISCTLTIIKR